MAVEENHVVKARRALERTKGLTLPNGPLIQNFVTGTQDSFGTSFFFNLNDDSWPKPFKKYLTWRGRQNAKNAEVEYHYHLLRQKPLIPLNFFE